MKRVKKKFIGLGFKISALIILMLGVMSSVMVVISYNMYRAECIENYGSIAVNIAGTISSNLDGDKFSEIMKSGDETEYWKTVKNSLEKTQTATGAKFVYAVSLNVNHEYHYFASAYYDVPIGFAQSDAFFAKELETAIELGKNTYSKVYDAGEDANASYGHLISGFAPIFDSSKKVVGAVGVDISVDKALADSHSFGVRISLVFVLLTTMIACLIYLYTRKTLGIPITTISNASKELAAGLMGIPQFQERNDEIGILSDNILKVAQSVNILTQGINTETNARLIDIGKLSGKYRLVAQGINKSISIIDNIDSFVYVVDMKTHEIVYVNNYMLNTLGNKNENITMCWQLFNQDHFEPCYFCPQKALDTMDENSLAYEWEYYFERLEKWFFFKNHIVRWIDGNLVNFCIGQDITVRKAYEAQQKKDEHDLNLAFLKAENAYKKIAEQHKTILSSIDYASKIQKNLLPREDIFEEAFSDYSIIWSPRDIVSGDIYWIKNFVEGSLLVVCDCTGHGTPGALLTMLVVSAFETVVNKNNYKDTAQVMWELEKRLVNVFHVNAPTKKGRNGFLHINDGCDLAILFIAKDGSVTISSGNTHVFICDGKEVTQIKGQKIHIGEGRLKGKDDIKTVTIPANPDNKFYIASDGLYDQIGGTLKPAIPFGYKTFKKIILENHNENQAAISEKIWKAFENYRGEQTRRDDVELITFKP